jgi:uncharacterized membrane protein HdeD (DUF308 family)
MITFGYNSKFSSPMRALLFIALGALMIFTKADAMQMVVKIFAAFILAAGIVSIFVGIKKKTDGTMPLSLFNALINVVLAGLLFAFAPFVSRFVSYLLGFVLFGFGIFQLLVLLSMRKNVQVGIVTYGLPALVTVVGLLMFFYPKIFGQSIGLIAGIALIVYGVSDLVSAFKMKAVKDADVDVSDPGTAVEESDDQIDAKEVEYEKVDEQ